MHKIGHYRNCTIDARVEKAPDGSGWEARVYITQAASFTPSDPAFHQEGVLRNRHDAMKSAIEFAKQKIDDGTAFYR